MTAPNRVDELRKRYHENPRRFFAPLANEYRKTGFVDRAILLCEKHLGEQPGNMNGLVVYGQCLFETGRLDEARVPFEMALGLDPENLIALRHLGDIARLGGDQPAARNWYQKLLEFDRRNDEVIALLAEVGGGEADAPAPASQAPSIISVASSVSVASEAESLGMIDLEPAEPAAPAPPPAPPRAATPPRAEAVSPPRAQTPVDPSAKTVEVTARPSQPPRRASLLDVSFDFGELGEAAAPTPALRPAPEPLLPAEAAEYGFAAPEPMPSFEDALDEILEEAPSAPPPPPPSAVTSSPSDPDAPLAISPLVETSPEGESLGEMTPIEGLLQADFSADVAPLADLESTEFEGGEAAPLDELEPSDFQPPARDTAALEGLETTEFTPPSFSAVPASRLSSDIEISPDDAFGLSMDLVEPDTGMPAELPAEPLDEPPVDEVPARRDVRASVAGLPLLEPLGTPTPMATPTVDDLPLMPSLEEAETLQLDVETLRERMEPPRQRMETPSTFVTETMAQVYVQQGHTDKAIAVYKQLVAQSPDDVQLRARLRALEAPMPDLPSMHAMPAATDPIDLDLEPIAESAPLAAQMPEPPSTPPVFEVAPTPRLSLGFDTPLTTEPVDEPAPANAMLSAMSFDGVSLSTPGAPPRRETPAAATPMPVPPAEPVAAGPSAREFFSKFLHRAATPASTPSVASGPSVGGALMSPLDEVFGTGVSPEDEAAAHRLAGVGATSGPSGGSALDSLFGEGPSAPMPSSTPSRGSVTRASEKLRFDQFFASSTPVEGSAAPPPPPAQQTDPEPVMGAADETEAEVEGPGEDDDLDQFQGWLRGLTS